MTPRYLLDTDWVIDYLCGVTEVVQRVKAYRNQGLTMSIITLGELYEGVYFSKDPSQSELVLQNFRLDVSVTPLNEDIIKIFARERGKLRKAGNLIGDFDLLIAATALCYHMTLLTNNTKHFQRIEGLSIESTPKQVPRGGV